MILIFSIALPLQSTSEFCGGGALVPLVVLTWFKSGYAARPVSGVCGVVTLIGVGVDTEIGVGGQSFGYSLHFGSSGVVSSK